MDQKLLNFKIEFVNCGENNFINSDIGRIKQILMNLISNSLKFTFNGSISISVAKVYKRDLSASFPLIEESKANDEYLKFIVKDTGNGISKNQIPKLFKMFGKLNKNSSLNKQGTGLGLTICKKLVESLGGSIQLKSKLDEGTEISFIIKDYPVAPVQNLNSSIFSIIPVEQI
mmetsp:Transcript_21076/g.18694  ORF Transcript_21076/g.18694 Transcript_21076/m.18694 type:complete len:173 (-) Transcript_21076:23-541(-)